MRDVLQKITRIEATITGDVQRTGFRYVVQDIARRLGVTGYVQNMPDGSAKIVAEAADEPIQKFVESIKIIDPPILVEDVKVSRLKPTGEFQFFMIKQGDLVDEMTEGFGAGLKYLSLSRKENKEGFESLRSETREGFQTLGGEMREGFHTLREDMKEGFQTLKTETKEGFNTLKEDMKESFQILRTETKEGFQTLTGEIKEMREDMNTNFQEMSTKYDVISQNLGQAIRIFQEESTKTREEMVRAVDNLSRLVDEFVKSRRGRDQ